MAEPYVFNSILNNPKLALMVPYVLMSEKKTFFNNYLYAFSERQCKE